MATEASGPSVRALPDRARVGRQPRPLHVDPGRYHVRDVEVVAAFDVDADKVGVDVAKAMAAGPTNTIRFGEVPPLGVKVQRGPTLDGFGEYYRQVCQESLGH